jgi:cation-transporting ATPase 13A1
MSCAAHQTSRRRKLNDSDLHVQVLRSGTWQSIPGEMLLPGDVFSVIHPHSTAAQKNEGDALVPADALLISGQCITDEAVLTGESTPQWKGPIASVLSCTSCVSS